jgi:hypothetical protein
LQVFPYESVIPAKGNNVSWASVWTQIERWNHDLPRNCSSPPYNASNGVPILVFLDNSGFRQNGAGGTFYWVKPEGTTPAHDQAIDNIGPATVPGTLDNFLAEAGRHSQMVVWGGAYKGFNSVNSAWGANRIMDQKCGQVWIKSLTEVNRFNHGDGVPYIQVITWNDYNEGTDIEAGIDNCYRVNASASNDKLEWELAASSDQANTTTVSEIRIYDSRDGEHLQLIASQPADTAGYLTLAKLEPGKHVLYVEMVGKNSILNRLSIAIPYLSRRR